MKKIKAFTLIELLVVIVIIGILATITSATFGNYTKKANDTKRMLLTREMGKALDRSMNTDFSDDFEWGYGNLAFYKGDRWYLGADMPGNIQSELEENGTEIPTVTDELCYGILHCVSDDPEENGFLTISYGDTTSTSDPSSPGLLLEGNPALKQYALEWEATQTEAELKAAGTCQNNSVPSCGGEFYRDLWYYYLQNPPWRVRKQGTTGVVNPCYLYFISGSAQVERFNFYSCGTG